MEVARISQLLRDSVKESGTFLSSQGEFEIAFVNPWYFSVWHGTSVP
jgi:hypothetical protein